MIPAWFDNMDKIVTPEQRAEIEKVSEELRALIPVCADLGRRVEALWFIPEAIDDLEEHALQLFNELTGLDAMHDLALLAAFLLERESNATPEHADELLARHADLIGEVSR